MSRGVFVVRDHLARLAREHCAPHAFDLGARFGDVVELGRGGSARVFAAWDRCTGERVAVKMLDRVHASSALFQARFEHEVSLHLEVRVPGVVRALGRAVSPSGRPLLLLELLDGPSLRELDGAADATLLSVLLDATRALEALHRAGIAHLDVKPDNLVASERGAHLVDLGLSRRMAEDAEPTGVTGTPPYAAPEVVLGARLDARTDVFALGVTALEVLTGTLPWVEASAAKLWMASFHGPALRLSALRPELGPELDLALARATEPDRRARDIDLAELASVFEAALARASHTPRARAARAIPLTTGFEEERRRVA